MLWPSGGRIINEAIERRADKSDAIHAYYAIVAVYFHTWRARDHVAQTHAIAHNRRQINLIFTKYSIFIIDFVFEWKRGFFFSLYRYALSHGYLFNNFNLINCMSNQLIMSVLQWSNASALLYVVSVYWLLSDAPVRLLVQRIVCLFFRLFYIFSGPQIIELYVPAFLLLYIAHQSFVYMHACMLWVRINPPKIQLARR